ncbi:MAG: cytochrome oxidase putative small subunit CydP [Pseudomonadota bacterium]
MRILLTQMNLRRDILIALTIKAVMLVALYQLFFAPRMRPQQSPATAANAILGDHGERR